MNYIRRALVTLLLASLYGGCFLLQGSCGNEFYLGVMSNRGSENDTTNKLLIAYDGLNSSEVTVETLTETLQSVTIPARSSMELSLPAEIVVTNGSYSQRHKGIRIRATNDVTVAVLSRNGNSSDAYRLYPTENIELESFVYYAITPGANDIYSSLVLIIGNQDNTSIRVWPTQSVNISNDLDDACERITNPDESAALCTLHRFQTLLIAFPGGDLTGTRIESDKPLTVISGHECAQFEIGSCSFIAEQIPPTIAWGQEYILSPLIAAATFNQSNTSQHYIVITSSSNTSINQSCINGTSEELILSEAGDWYNTSSAQFCSLRSNVSILVALIYEGYHPLMTLVPSLEQYVTNVSLTTFSCTDVTSVMLLSNTIHPDYENDNTTNTNLVQALDIGSVSYLLFEDMLSVNDIRLSAIVYTIGNLSCSFAYTAEWKVNTFNDISIPTLTFAASQYNVSEDEGSVDIVINRTSSTSQLTVVTVSTVNNGASDDDYYPLFNDTIIFEAGETQKTLTINITNDEWVETPEQFLVVLSSMHDRTGLYDRTIVTILDDDGLVVSLFGMTYESTTHLLLINCGVARGVLAPNNNLNVTIQLQEKILLNRLQLSHEVVSHVLKVNLSRVELCSNQSSLSCFVVSELVLNSPTLNVTLSSGRLNGTLADFVLQETCDFIIGEFSQQSLIIASCVAGVLLLACLVATGIGISGCVMSYHTKRKWTLGGGLNKLYFQDDAMSLATNDPESYELMNRLGEKKTAILAINDDNEY